jgi:phytol kinase
VLRDWFGVGEGCYLSPPALLQGSVTHCAKLCAAILIRADSPEEHMRYRGTFKLELVRKLGHVLTGIFLVLLVQSGLLPVPVLGLLILLFAALILYNVKEEKELLTKILSINRIDAKIPGLEILSFFIGCWLVLVLFSREIAFAAILILAFGDSVAHLVSRRFGATQTFMTKTTYLEGTIAGIVAGTLAAWSYVPLLPALLASVAAMIVEAGELRIGDHHIDDNFLIPLIAAATLWVISLAFPFTIYPF